MIKKTILIIVSALIVIAAGAFLLNWLNTGESAVLSNDDNTITLHAKRSGDGSGGTGTIVIHKGEKMRIEHTLTKGSFDFTIGINERDALEIPTEEFLSGDLVNALVGYEVYSQKGIEGNGSLDITIDPGEYTLLITYHNATGEGTISAVANTD